MREGCGLALDSITELFVGIRERAPVLDESIEGLGTFSSVKRDTVYCAATPR